MERNNINLEENIEKGFKNYLRNLFIFLNDNFLIIFFLVIIVLIILRIINSFVCFQYIDFPFLVTKCFENDIFQNIDLWFLKSSWFFSDAQNYTNNGFSMICAVAIAIPTFLLPLILQILKDKLKSLTKNIEFISKQIIDNSKSKSFFINSFVFLFYLILQNYIKIFNFGVITYIINIIATAIILIKTIFVLDDVIFKSALGSKGLIVKVYQKYIKDDKDILWELYFYLIDDLKNSIINDNNYHFEILLEFFLKLTNKYDKKYLSEINDFKYGNISIRSLIKTSIKYIPINKKYFDELFDNKLLDIAMNNKNIYDKYLKYAKEILSDKDITKDICKEERKIIIKKLDSLIKK